MTRYPQFYRNTLARFLLFIPYLKKPLTILAPDVDPNQARSFAQDEGKSEMATALQSRTTKSLRKTEYRLNRQRNAIQEEYLRRHYERHGGKPETEYEVELSITYLITVNAESEAQAECLVQEFPLEAFDYVDTTDVEVVSAGECPE